MINKAFYQIYKKYLLCDLFLLNTLLWLNEEEPYREERIKVVQAIINQRIKERNLK